MPAPVVLQQSNLRAVVPRNKVSATAGSSIVGHPTACKCEICTCGKHRCDVKKDFVTHYDKDLLTTTSAADYGRKTAAPAVSAAPSRAYEPSLVKFSGESEYSASHHGEKGAAATPFIPNGTNTTIHPSNERHFDSENRSEYGPKGYNRRDGFKPKNAIPPPVPFTAETSNKADFKVWDGAKPSTPFKAKNELQPPTESRDFQSESAMRYVEHPYSKAAPFIPARGAPNTAKFEGQSTAQADFQKWDGVARAEPFRPVGNQQAMAETRDFRSEAREEYGRKDAAPAVSAAPKRGYNPSPVKFSGESEYSASHHGEKGAAATPFIPNGTNTTIHPSNERHFDSENRSEYGPKGYNRRDGFKPKNAIPPPVPFTAETSNKADFKVWDGAKPSTPFKAKNELQPPTESRDFQSESAMRYVEHPYSKAAPFIPARGAPNTAKFDAESTNRSDFQGYVFAACPAAPLSSDTQKLDSGHLLYHQTPRGSWNSIN